MKLHAERGAMLVHVSILMMGLLAISGFAIDYGQFWVARRQAQNVADAGAHAGAVARGFDDLSLTPPIDSGKVYESIVNTVETNRIWGVPAQAATIDINYDCPPGVIRGWCVTVDVHRDGTGVGREALPTYFLRLAGITSQPVRATATARVREANSTECLRPWMLPDKFADVNGNGTFDDGDEFIFPGYTRDDIGKQFVISPNADGSIALNADGLPILTDYNIVGDTAYGRTEYSSQIVACALKGWLTKPLSNVPIDGSEPTDVAVNQLINSDPTAGWDDVDKAVTGPYGFGSPRVVVVGLYDPEAYHTAQQQPSEESIELPIINLIALFIEDVENGVITARLVARGGDLKPNVVVPPRDAAFLRAIHLLR
jgi:hypothetical protein